MKKFLSIVAVVAVLILFSVSIASANGGPHGGYTPTTDACAGCHRAHTASGPNLLIEASTYDLCMSCHDAAGTGADTNVEDGQFMARTGGDGSGSLEGDAQTTVGGSLLGGGFANYGGVAVTSIHDADGTTAAAWGNTGVLTATRGVTQDLTDGNLSCASCHDPHGSSNYRIIKETVNGVAVTVTQVDEGAANKDYDDEQWPADLSNVCAACHVAYHVTSAGSGSDPAMVATGGYTHRVDMNYAYGGNVNPETVGYSGYFLPLADSGVSDLVTCNTCHLSHGSSAQMTGYGDGGPTGTGTLPGNTTATDSALLRLDNRGVCEVCHQK